MSVETLRSSQARRARGAKSAVLSARSCRYQEGCTPSGSGAAARTAAAWRAATRSTGRTCTAAGSRTGAVGSQYVKAADAERVRAGLAEWRRLHPPARSARQALAELRRLFRELEALGVG